METMESIVLEDKRVTHHTDELAVHDLGDGIGCVAFRTKGNSISPGVREFRLNIVSWNFLGYDGLVIGNQAKNFSVGANLYSIKEDIDKKNFQAFEDRVKAFQTMTMAIKQSRKPIVAAPYKNTLGGGLEVVLHAHARVALRKSYLGLVEIGVGLIPGGGGTKESALLVGRTEPSRQIQVLKDTFDKLIIRTVSGSAEHAVELGYLKNMDTIVDTPEELLGTAKALCQDLRKNDPNKTVETVTLPGKKGYEAVMAHAAELLADGAITPYDLEIGKKIASVLCGSATEGPREYSEWQLLDLERAAFFELTQARGTAERITHFIEKNELLRN